MALFEVPGWSMPSAPIHADEPTTRGAPKKRKRPSSDPSRVATASVNVDKLVSKLSRMHPEAEPSTRNIQRKGSHIHEESPKKKRRKTKASEKPLSKEGNTLQRKDSTLSKAKKQDTPAPKPEASNEPNPKSQSGPLTALQKGMKQSLDGARFRLINENLYKSDSHDAHRMMQDDPKVFEEYHIGFRHQVLSWPTNPVDHYTAKFESLPPRTIIADLGCGDAALAKGLVPKGISVLSFDLVSDGKYVVEADICERIPLPGSEGVEGEKSPGEGQVVDVVVCALSLMGTNWVNCLREAWRVLKPSGQLHIAEVTSRFVDLERFVSAVGSVGFRLKFKDSSNTHFVLFEFVKVPRSSLSDKEWTKLRAKGSMLKPCEYKRR